MDELDKIFESAFRKGLGYTQIAELIGVHRDTPRRWHKGLQKISYEHFVALKQAVKGYRG